MSTGQPRVLSAALVAVAAGMFLMQLDATVANLALPSIGADLGVATSGLQWVIDGYTIPLAALLLIGGRLGDRFGHRTVFLTGLTLFGIGSLACALATTPGILIGARIAQGLGAALELPASLALLARCYPDPTVRARAIGVWASVGGLALAIGPLVGGPLVEAFGWQSVFLVNVPIVAVALVLTWRAVPADTRRSSIGLSLPSQLLGTLVLVALTVGIIEHEPLTENGWALAAAIVIGLAALAGFVVVDRRSATPLLPASVLGNRTFLAVTAAALVMGFILFGLLFAYSLIFQQGWGDDPTIAGFRFLPLAVAFILTGPLAERIGAKDRPHLVAGIGLVLLAAATAALALLPDDASYALIAVAFVAVGVGYGLLSATLAIAAVGALAPEQQGVGSAIQNTARQLGGVLGVAIAGAQIAVGTLSATTANLTFAILGVIAVLLLATLRPKRSGTTGAASSERK